jgi:hypothetical protein
MLTPEKWNAFFNEEVGFSQKVLKRRVEMEVRAHLAELMPGITISTNELGEALYPRAIAEASLAGDKARTTLFKMIGVLANDALSDCCVKGEINGQFMGKPKRPWLWFCPGDTKVCPQCGQPLPSDEDAL